MGGAKAGKQRGGGDERVVCEHRRAKFDYEFDDTLEAGLVLLGSEVKALRDGEASLNDAYALPVGGELFLNNAHIGAYRPSAVFGHLPTRPRKLLLHRRELEKWSAKVRERGFAVIPIRLYFKGAKVKVLLGLGRGKTNVDRRHSIRERETRRELDRVLRRK